MPIYTYICKDCGEKFDLLVGVTAEKTEIECKKCKSKNVERTMSAFSVGTSSCSTGTCSTGTCPTCPTCF